ncbi:MAG: glycosyltransferase family 39 protein [Planctomycetota bacterium]|jgi:uncharacterized membrane protein
MHPTRLALLGLVVLLASYLRVTGLGARSLWLDEFSTWHVSRMDLSESLHWGPELSKPPLYQLCLRALTREARPEEWLLRFPAAAAGILSVLAGWWLGRVAGGWVVGCCLAGLLACNVLQIDYAQEARSYTMLVAGCTLSVVLWHRVVTMPRWPNILGYVVVTVLAFHAHYLTALAVCAQVCWWVVTLPRRPREQRSLRPLAALAATAALCTPIVVHYLYWRSAMFQGLAWIEPPTWHDALATLERLTFGPVWVLALLVPSILVWLFALRRHAWRGIAGWRGQLFEGVDDAVGLLLIWLVFAWFGLMVISWVVQPAMLARYALPAAVPALAVPLLVACRIDRWAGLVIALAFMLGTANDWLPQGRVALPGFRELSGYLNEHVDGTSEATSMAVVLTIDNTTYPNWEDMERLGFEYYPLDGLPLYELHLAPDGVTAKNAILEDERTLYLVVLRADPFAVLEAAGRHAVPIEVNGVSFRQLLFSPYRLVKVAPLTGD